MTRPQVEVADVFRAHESALPEAFGNSLSVDQRRALHDIIACRTSTLGGHVEECDGCGHRRIAYNSCRNRHCPKCQAMARAEWLEARAGELLPVPYFHVVFTLPGTLGPIALQNKRVVYGILFQAAAETMKEVAANPKHLGAQIGILAVLHTWSQNLTHHPHVHCVVTGGGLAPDGSRWVPCKRSRKRKREFLAPVKVLSRVFRGKFIALLKRAFRRHDLQFHGKLVSMAQPKAFEKHLNLSVRKEWVVYAKRPFGGPEQVLKYLARYTHRVAISSKRVINFRDGKVTFRWRDYADGGKQKTMELDATEFMRRFLLHVLPRGFVRIRHYGFLANGHRTAKLASCRKLLGVDESCETSRDGCPDPTDGQSDEPDVRCPVCERGKMIRVDVIQPSRKRVEPRRPYILRCRTPHVPALLDTS